MSLISADSVYDSAQLSVRPTKAPDYRRENLAIRELAGLLNADADLLLARFVAEATALTSGSSAGLSLLDAANDDAAFVWCCVSGALSVFEGARTPRNNSPCGVTLDRNEPTLSIHPERAYDWVAATGVPIPEVLLVPLRTGDGNPFGTLWVVSDEEGHFDAEDARVLAQLADFISMSLAVFDGHDRLKRALEEQELLTREMNHRIKNLFAMSDGMIRVSAKKARSAEELASLLSGRFAALAQAHDLVRRTDTCNDSAQVDLGELIGTVLGMAGGRDGETRFSLAGPAVPCGENAVTSLALVVHELTTNAVKYGGLSGPGGRVSVSWSAEGAMLVLRWTESGGPPVSAQPERQGFGTTLIERTVTSRFRGAIRMDWTNAGLEATLSLQLEHLIR